MDALVFVLLGCTAVFSVLQILVHALVSRRVGRSVAAVLPVFVFVIALTMNPQVDGTFLSPFGPALLSAAILWQLAMVAMIIVACVRKASARR